MANPNPLAGVVPRVVHEIKNDETTISEYVEKIEGEVALDGYVKAQTSAPEVVKRITELENCLQRLASAVWASGDVEGHPELRAAVEEAKLVLKNRLEVDESKHRFHSELARLCAPDQREQLQTTYSQSRRDGAPNARHPTGSPG
jgi:hypothetical protein